jgi:dolichol-phosphate mannosyltransferase
MNSALAVITPVGRESKTISDFVTQVQSQLNASDMHFLVTDDYTDEASLSIIQELSKNSEYLITLVNLQVSRGIADVYLKGYERALAENYTHFLEIDAGFSHDPNQIKDFKLASLSNDVVFGSRFIEGAEYQSKFSRKIFSKGGSLLARALLKTQVLDLTSGYQLFSRKALLAILGKGIRSKGPFFQTEMKYFACEMKFIYKEVPISYSNPSRQITLSDVAESLLSLFRLTILK